MNYHGLMSSTQRICAVDGFNVTRNTENYFIGLTLWYGVLHDNHINTNGLMPYLEREGLRKTIQSCDRIAEWLVNADAPLTQEDIRNPLYKEVYTYAGRRGVLPIRNALRFLRRFSPDTEGAFNRNAATAFLQVQKEMKRMNWRLKRDFNSKSIGIELMRIIPAIFKEPEVLQLPNGNCQESKHGVASKLIALESYLPFSNVLPGLPGYTREVCYPKTYNGELLSKIAFVGKDYKTSRTIAVESVATYYHTQQGVNYLMQIIDYINHNYPCPDGSQPILVDDAETQRERCAYAATDGELATYDFSAASDRICIQLVKNILPPFVYNEVAAAVSRYGTLSLDKKVTTLKLHSFSTMGSKVTFPLECLIFYLVSRYALYDSNDRIGCFWDSQYNDVSFHGDDGILPVVDTEWFTAFGFKPNVEKSFYGNTFGNYRFREACGVECFGDNDGLYEYQPIYISREPLYNGRVINVNALLSLRCRAYQQGWFSTVRVIDNLFLDEGYKLYYADPCYCALELENEDFMGVLPSIDDSQTTGYTCPYSEVPQYQPLGYQYKGNLVRISPQEYMEAIQRPVRYEPATRITYKPTDVELEAAERYSYCKFLQYGPTFRNALDELLGISQPNDSEALLYGKDDRELTGVRRLKTGRIIFSNK